MAGSEPFHISLNPSAPTTLLLLHGLLSSHLEYAHVTPHLPTYHLLIPDLPGHSRSSHLAPSTIPHITNTIATLIRTHAHNGRAHIIGLSMGGFVALDLAHRYPELCQSLFVTGAAPFEGAFAFIARRPWIAYGIMWVMDSLPDGVYWWLCKRNGMVRHEELRVEMRRNRRWGVVREVYGSILGIGWETVREIQGVRCLCVAGGKQDDLGSTRRVGEVWRANGIGKAVVVREALHAWDLQMPEVFARGVRAWVEEGALPGEFEELD
ncbi:hypothetical protein OQA88_9154 [Cercophora sp. LCS_1]